MTYKEFCIMMDQAKREVDSTYRKKVNMIRHKVYELNKEVGFYGIDGMEYKEFLEAMRSYSYEDQMKVAYALLQHIALLDNIVFDEEGEA